MLEDPERPSSGVTSYSYTPTVYLMDVCTYDTYE